MSITYQPRTREQLEARINSRDGGDFDSIFKNVPLYKPKPSNHIRILMPTWQGATHYGYDMRIHYGVGPDRQSYLSLAMNGQPDPVEEQFIAAKNAGNDELAKKFRATRRIGVYLIDRHEEEKGVQLWAMPITVDSNIAECSIDPQSGAVLMIDHPDEGYDVYFNKTGVQLNTRYEGIQIARVQTPLSTDAAKRQAWLEFIATQPLPSVLQFYSYDRIKEVMEGRAPSVSVGNVASPADAASVPATATTTAGAPTAAPAPTHPTATAAPQVQSAPPAPNPLPDPNQVTQVRTSSALPPGTGIPGAPTGEDIPY